jgi:hypothetical protein
VPRSLKRIEVGLDRFERREFVFVACCSFRVLGKSFESVLLFVWEVMRDFVMERSRGSNGEGEQQG